MLLQTPIKTDRLFLKNLSSEDARGNYFHWLCDPKVNQFLEIRHQIPDINELEFFIEKMNDSNNNLLLGIYLREGIHIGNIKLGPIHPIYSRATMGLMIGDQAQWGRGYATEAIRALTDYAFQYLQLSAVWAGCYSTNIASHKAFLKAGYTEGARQAQYWKIDDEFVDNILLVKYGKAAIS